jgi:hypothetical protein
MSCIIGKLYINTNTDIFIKQTVQKKPFLSTLYVQVLYAHFCCFHNSICMVSLCEYNMLKVHKNKYTTLNLLHILVKCKYEFVLLEIQTKNSQVKIIIYSYFLQHCIRLFLLTVFKSFCIFAKVPITCHFILYMYLVL